MQKEITNFFLDIWHQVSPILSVIIVVSIVLIAFWLYGKLMDKIDN